MTPPDKNLGVLAFGDSITNGGGELQWGVALHSWALWVARALGVPFSGYAVDGATAGDVVSLQIPLFERTAVNTEAQYDLGCLYIGVNDVRSVAWDPPSFQRDHNDALTTLKGRANKVLTLTAPLDLGRPRAGAKVRDLNAIVTENARRHDALLLDLSDFKGRNLLMADHVHPTAFGQIAIAERALATLAGDGLQPRIKPTQLITYQTSWRRRLRGDVTYAYRHAKVSLRAAALTAAFALRPR